MYYAKEVGSGDDVELTMFSSISVPFFSAMFTWTYPMKDGDGNENGVIERNLGAGLQVRLPSPRLARPGSGATRSRLMNVSVCGACMEGIDIVTMYKWKDVMFLEAHAPMHAA